MPRQQEAAEAMLARKLFILILAAAVPAAGCVSLADTIQPDDAVTDAKGALEAIGLPIVQDHDHSDPALHKGGANMELLDYNPLIQWPDEFGQNGFAEVTVHGDYAYVAVLGTPGGFFIVDISDPRDTKVVGRYETFGLRTYDVKISDDGNWAFLGIQGSNTEEGAVQEAAQGGDAAAPGVQAIDISDKTNPRFVSYWANPPSGSHNVFYYNLEGRHIVMSTTSNFAFDPTGAVAPGFLASDPVFTKVAIMELQEVGGEHHLVLLSEYRMALSDPLPFVTDQRNINSMVYVHDMTAQEHPVTGQHLMYVAHWEAGLRIVDISDPENPVEVGAFDELGPAEYMNIHYVQPHPGLIAGKHVTIAAPELLVSRDSGFIRVIDTTDPANPEQLGVWELPGDIVNDQNLIFSPHNLDLQDGRMVIGHYHAGVWLVDISTEELLKAPKTLAYHLPNGDADHVIEKGTVYTDGGYFKEGWVSNVWAAVFTDDGTIVASDIPTGLYTLKFTGDAAV